MKLFFLGISFIFVNIAAAQNNSMADMLWSQVGGRIDTSKDHGGQYEIVDDAKNGYLKVAFTEDGCGCYTETTIGAYKDNNGNYTTLQMDREGCGWRKTLLSNKVLNSFMPENFGLRSFLPKSDSTEYEIPSSVFFLEAEIPRKGTDTKIDLSYIPFGINMAPYDQILSYGYELVDEHGGANYRYQEELQAAFRNISDENTLQCILEQTLENITPKDREVMEKLYGEGKKYRSIDELGAQIRQLKTIYEISKDIEYKSVILGWDRAKARFFVKEKIKNDAPKMSFLEFVRQLPFLTAIC